jgi:ornithine cyclodeaminase
MKVITISNLVKLIQTHGLNDFLRDLIEYLKNDFRRWHTFDKSARYAAHYQAGVIELMPIHNKEHFFYKYVNGHPKNPNLGKQTVIALGQLSTTQDGYPLLMSEMTLLTALRTAATSALATDLLASKNAQTLAIIGTGAQSEFQVIAHRLVRSIKQVRYYDVDPMAAHKFQENLKDLDVAFTACDCVKDAISGADIIIVCTAAKKHANVIQDKWIQGGIHINALGSDAPGKTELEKSLLLRSHVIVEYKKQSVVEGEIQQLDRQELNKVLYAELWELVSGKTLPPQEEGCITVFDCVGFALEDYSTIRLVNDLSDKHGIGEEMDLIPTLPDPKNLFSLLQSRGDL